MNPSSHYRKRLVEHLLKNNKQLGSKSKKEISIKPIDTKMPMHISLKTPLNLTDSCSKYSYNISNIMS